MKYRGNTEELRQLGDSSHGLFSHHFVLLERNEKLLVHATGRAHGMVIREPKLHRRDPRNTCIPKMQDEGSSRLDDVYLGYRIAIKFIDGAWTASIFSVRGPKVFLTARASLSEGEATCAVRARETIDRYLAYLSSDDGEI